MLVDSTSVVMNPEVAEVSPKAFKEQARAKVLDGQCWTMPVVANGRSHVGELVCLDCR
ncbi:MAG: hypothetical protein ACLP9L_42095 [Thermoguttaceae bacterium]